MTCMFELLPAYGDYLRYERQLAASTVAAYVSDARHLGEYTNKPIEAVTRNDLRAYMAYLGQQGYAASTVRRMFHGYGTLWTWLYLESYASEILTQHLTLPRKNTSAPDWLSEDELKRLLAVKAYPHDHLAWKTLAWLGLRPGELRALRVRDVEPESGVMIVRNTKSRRDRLLPLPLELQEDFGHFTAYAGREDYIFGHHGKWQRRHMAAAFQRSLEAAGLSGRGLTPKVLRHTFATHLALRGVPGHVLQALLGHRDLSTTQVYLHIAPASLRAALAMHVLNQGG